VATLMATSRTTTAMATVVATSMASFGRHVGRGMRSPVVQLNALFKTNQLSVKLTNSNGFDPSGDCRDDVGSRWWTRGG
jgi:hypothetical protein